MDPNATICDMCDAIQQHDYDVLEERSEALRVWLLNHGFMPTINKDQLVTLCWAMNAYAKGVIQNATA